MLLSSVRQFARARPRKPSAGRHSSCEGVEQIAGFKRLGGPPSSRRLHASRSRDGKETEWIPPSVWGALPKAGLGRPGNPAQPAQPGRSGRHGRVVVRPSGELPIPEPVLECVDMLEIRVGLAGQR